MNLFIIGNGFDRGHGLPTRYWDFRIYLQKKYPDFLEEFESHYDIYSATSNERKEEILWNRFESNLANIDEEDIINSCESLDLRLESGDIYIEDMLYDFFSEEYNYIKQLSRYLKQWIRTIRIRDCVPRTSLISEKNNDKYITFNYTAVLETVYGISPDQILHIHGSLRNYTKDPVIGHGNLQRIQAITAQIEQAEERFDEKLCSICKVIKNYYTDTFKDTKKYSYSLYDIAHHNINQIYIIGHSLDGIDMPYFSQIDRLTDCNLIWNVYIYEESEIADKKNALISVGITPDRINVLPAYQFYDLN